MEGENMEGEIIMATIDYKEKYEKAVQAAMLAKQGTESAVTVQTLEEIFPELRESEDERIRKYIISFIELNSGVNLPPDDAKEMLAWLEKKDDKDKLIKELSEHKVKYTQEVLEKHINSMNNKDDERLRNTTISFLEDFAEQGYENAVECIDWLEKQGTPAKLSEEEQNRFAKGILTSCALSFIDYLDAHKYEGKMCVSNGECEDIENAFHNAMWDRLHRYYCKYIEKQGEQKFEQKFFINDKVVHKATGKIWTIHHYLKDTNSYYVEDNDGLLYHYRESELKLVEQKSTDKVEPKFKVGDWVIDKQGIVHQIANVIENVTNHTYAYDIVGGGYFNDNTEGVRLWTIQDTKAGDVLCCENGWTCIFKTLVNDETFSSYCFMDSTKWFCETGSECHTLKEEFVKAYNGKIHPATQEQRSKLFSKMAAEGYEWDADKKELKKVEQKPTEWNIFDYRTWQYIVADVLTKKEGIGQYFDDSSCKNIAKYMQEEWSKKLSTEQNLLGWSEEDEYVYNEILKRVADKKLYEHDLEYIHKWLKSLRPQNRWKPSQSMINALSTAVKYGQTDDLEALSELLKQLKEL